jgi:hypothetical protein
LRAPKESNLPEGQLLEGLLQTFGTFEAFVEQFSTAAVNNF